MTEMEKSALYEINGRLDNAEENIKLYGKESKTS